MKRNIYFVKYFFIILFTIFSLSTISSQNICSININNFFSDIFLDRIDNPFMINQELNIKENLSNPSFQEKIKNISFENKKRLSELDKELLSKWLPHMINQKKINEEKINDLLVDDINFKNMYNYAKELGYDKSNVSLEIIYDNMADVILTTFYNKSSTNKEIIFLVKIKDKNNSNQFLMGLEEKDGTPILKMFDKSGGIIINLTDSSTISSWGHHSCAYWDCVRYGILWYDENTDFNKIGCFNLCSTVLVSIETPVGPVSIGLCAGCLLSAGLSSLEFCSETLGGDPCYFYPCQDDCDDYDGYYNSPIVYFCNGNDQYVHRKFYNFYCSATYGPREGSCDYINNYVDETFVQHCPYGCSNGECNNPTTCYSDINCGENKWVGLKKMPIFQNYYCYQLQKLLDLILVFLMLSEY